MVKMRGEHALPCSPVWKMSPNSVVDITRERMEEGGSNQRMAVREQTVDQTCFLPASSRRARRSDNLDARPWTYPFVCAPYLSPRLWTSTPSRAKCCITAASLSTTTTSAAVGSRTPVECGCITSQSRITFPALAFATACGQHTNKPQLLIVLSP